ncbi:hypothetical protein KR51_00003240 [Rubidibacter lacunae KORDI 51-2]|uniref:Uncharacterized protein n=1 Tax=Rubidibacter lacunae KORDI 51-2 TaxID=582515 RepID=U5DMW5_9CHRO|nr:hypothetical protein [Rubidibacter lacunae]ERN43011.1 hypothetical protein KR51_00003240 [Rubidibacter lacunae KORDI 51-2]
MSTSHWNYLKNVTDGLVPRLTQNITTAANAATDGAHTLIERGAGLVTGAGAITQNTNAFGFAFEHLQVIGYNIKASLSGSESRAWQIPAKGIKNEPDIYVTDAIGRTIAEVQAKVGSAEYVSRNARGGNYRGQKLVTDAANEGIPGTEVVIEVDGVRSAPIDIETAKWVAGNPYLAAQFIEVAALGGEAVSGGVVGATVNVTISALLNGIELVGAYCRGEEELAPERIQTFQRNALDALNSGFVRGVAIKLLQRLLRGNAFVTLGIMVGAEAVQVLIELLKGDVSLEEGVAIVGPQALTAGLVTTVVLIFPPVGAAFFSASILQAVWQEVTPEYKQYVIHMVAAAGGGAASGVEVDRTATAAFRSPQQPHSQPLSARSPARAALKKIRDSIGGNSFNRADDDTACQDSGCRGRG